MWVASNILTIFTQYHGLRSFYCCIPKKAPETTANLAMQEYSNQTALPCKAQLTSSLRASLRQQQPVNDHEVKKPPHRLSAHPNGWRPEDQSLTNTSSLNK